MRLLCLFVSLATLLSASVAFAADGMPDAVRKSLNEKLIGEWTLEFKRGNAVSSGTSVAKWSPGKHSIRIDFTETGKGRTTKASEMMGWDADAKCLTIHGFGAESTNWTTRFTDFASNKWKGSWKGFFDGKTDGSTCTLELRGDTYEYRDTTDGNPLIISATRK